MKISVSIMNIFVSPPVLSKNTNTIPKDFSILLKDSSAWSSQKQSLSSLKVKYAGYTSFWIVHFVPTVCNPLIIYIKLNMPVDKVNEVSHVSYSSLLITVFNRLPGKVANKCCRLQVAKLVWLNWCRCLVWVCMYLLTVCSLSWREVWINSETLRRGVVLNPKEEKSFRRGIKQSESKLNEGKFRMSR